jgi:hypothetical protein
MTGHVALRSVLSGLERVDWNFPGSGTTRNSVHLLHRYPGNFIPEIPAYLIQLLSSGGDLIADPFCGSGTTGIEAILQGRRAWQSDSNRASVLIARGKLAAISGQCDQDAFRKLLTSLGWELRAGSRTNRGRLEGSARELAKWYHPDTVSQLRSVWDLIAAIDEPHSRAALEMIFSDTLFACASTGGSKTSTGGQRKHHWGWVADNVLPNPPIWHDAKRQFRERLGRLVDFVTTFRGSDVSTSVVECQDIRCVSPPTGLADVVITSPPYVGMIDYVLANRLTYLWFGWPLLKDRDIEIGARCRRNRRTEPQEYLHWISVACDRIYSMLRPGGYCAIVIGASRKHHEMATRVVGVFAESLQLIWGPKRRVPGRRRVSERKGTEPTELICVYRKQ